MWVSNARRPRTNGAPNSTPAATGPREYSVSILSSNAMLCCNKDASNVVTSRLATVSAHGPGAAQLDAAQTPAGVVHPWLTRAPKGPANRLQIR